MLKSKLRKNNKNNFSWGDFFGEAVSQLVGELVGWIFIALLTTFPLFISWMLISSGLFWLILPFIILFLILVVSIFKRVNKSISNR